MLQILKVIQTESMTQHEDNNQEEVLIECSLSLNVRNFSLLQSDSL